MKEFYLEALNNGEARLGLYQIPTDTRDSKVTGRRLATISGWQLRVAQSTLAMATKGAGRNRALLTTANRKKVFLKEEDGVRLALVFRGLSDLRDTFRAHELVSGVHLMSREECYYWYAKVFSSSTRGLRALRVLIAGVK